MLSWRSMHTERPSPGLPALAALLVGAAVFSLGLPALCSGAAEEGGQTLPAVVLILPEQTDDVTYRAADAIASQLADLPVAFLGEHVEGWEADLPSRVHRARTLAADHGAITAFWIDLYEGKQVFLFIAAPDGGRMLVRNIQYSGEGTEAYLETIAVIVRSAVKAILAGGEIGVTAPPPPPPTPATPPPVEAPPEPPPREPGPERLLFSAAYAAQLYSPELSVIHGARFEAALRVANRIHVFFAYRLQFPGAIASSNLNVYIRPHPIELGLFARWRPDEWRVVAGAAAVIDIVTFDSASSSDRIAAITPDTEVGFLLSPSVSVGRTVGRGACVTAAVDLDISLKSQKYVLKNDNENTDITAPWPVRPMFRLGMTFSLL